VSGFCLLALQGWFCQEIIVEYDLVKCFRRERSQLVNKRLALTRLAALFAGEQAEKEKQFRSALRYSHWELERGNPMRVYDGETLKLIADNSAILPPG
jgi:protein subunit release factor B